MISAEQLQQLRATASAAIGEVFATTITIGAHADIPAARWSATKAAAIQPLGLMLPTVDLTLRVDRAELATRSLTITEGKTTFTESGQKYRVERVRDALGDPALVIEARAI